MDLMAQARVSGARSRWIGAAGAAAGFLNSWRHGLAPATINMPSTTPTTTAVARLRKPVTSGLS
jgi:hypothetical protein